MSMSEVRGGTATRRPRNRLTREDRIGAGVLVLAAVAFAYQVFGGGANVSGLAGSISTFALIVSVVSFGQGLAVLSGGLDLSIPWTMTLGGVLIAEIADGSNERATWGIPLVLFIGASVGAINGLGIVLFRLPAIIMTLAMNVLLQGILLLHTNGTPSGAAPLFLGKITGEGVGGTSIPTALVGLLAVLVIGSAIQNRSAFGRRIAAVGESPRTAYLSGVGSDRIIIAVYAVSGMCASLGGCLLAGFSARSTLGMGDAYLLPSIAAVVLGGAAVTGGRGAFFGTVAGALFIGGLQAVLGGFSVGAAWRSILFGGVILLSATLLQPGTLQALKSLRHTFSISRKMPNESDFVASE